MGFLILVGISLKFSWNFYNFREFLRFFWDFQEFSFQHESSLSKSSWNVIRYLEVFLHSWFFFGISGIFSIYLDFREFLRLIGIFETFGDFSFLYNFGVFQIFYQLLSFFGVFFYPSIIFWNLGIFWIFWILGSLNFLLDFFAFFRLSKANGIFWNFWDLMKFFGIFRICFWLSLEVLGLF